MKINKDELLRIAEQAHIYLGENEIEIMRQNVNNILEYVSVLDKYQLDTNADGQTVTPENRFREDIAKPSASLQDALHNAPKKNEFFFKVPKMLDND